MAIFPRTVLAQPAAAAVATVALFGFTVIGLAAYQASQGPQVYQNYEHPCSALAHSTPGPTSAWSEGDWVRLTECFVGVDDMVGALEIATEGVMRYPRSEMLINLKGYHQIGLGSYEEAIDTLETGLHVVGHPRSGVMENNLAWAYLYTGDGAEPRTRALYQRALVRSPDVCELIHTGLFVEFEHANGTTSVLDRSAALIRFAELRQQYSSCMMRDGTQNTGVEAIGVSVLYNELLRAHNWEVATMRGITLQSAAQATAEMSTAELCTEAMPIARLRGECTALVDQLR